MNALKGKLSMNQQLNLLQNVTLTNKTDIESSKTLQSLLYIDKTMYSEDSQCLESMKRLNLVFSNIVLVITMNQSWEVSNPTGNSRAPQMTIILNLLLATKSRRNS